MPREILTNEVADDLEKPWNIQEINQYAAQCGRAEEDRKTARRVEDRGCSERVCSEAEQTWIEYENALELARAVGKTRRNA